MYTDGADPKATSANPWLTCFAGSDAGNLCTMQVASVCAFLGKGWETQFQRVSCSTVDSLDCILR